MDLNPAEWWERTRQYVVDVRTEFRKVTWPSRREYLGGTVGVIVVTAFITLVIGLFDLVLTRLMKVFLG